MSIVDYGFWLPTSKRPFRQGQTLIEFALAMPVIVAVFTIIFALGYAAYKVHSASSAGRGLDMHWDNLANSSFTPSIINEAFSGFTDIAVSGPTSGFQAVRGDFVFGVKWIPGVPTITGRGCSVVPGDLLASNLSGSPSQLAPVTPLPLGSLLNPMAFCNVDPKYCISLSLMAKKFPKILTTQDNCDTDIGVFTDTEPLKDENGNILRDGLGNPVLTDKVAPVNCAEFDPPEEATCYSNKAKHAAHYVTQFVKVADKNGGCVGTDTGTLLVPVSEYPTFIPPGDY